MDLSSEDTLTRLRSALEAEIAWHKAAAWRNAGYVVGISPGVRAKAHETAASRLQSILDTTEPAP
jgi:hypothetical protein